MFLHKLHLTNFKNYKTESIDFSKKVNLIYGLNGSGKTNLLDAIYYLAITKSNFQTGDKYLVREGSEFFRLEARIGVKDEHLEKLEIKYPLGKKKEILLNKVKKKSAAEIIGEFPVVFVAPDDSKIVKEDSRPRRSFIDRLLSQCDRHYLTQLMVYNKVMKQKNAHLKGHRIDRLVIEGLNVKLKECSRIIHQRRKDFIVEFSVEVQKNYRDLSEGREEVHLAYVSQLNDRDLSYFDQIVADEIMQRRPLFGPHRDDYELLIDQKSLKMYGSQGQIKSFLYALRLAEFDYLKKETGRIPFLILDDFFEKLDGLRLSRLIKRISNDTFEQVFLSDTEKKRSQEIFNHHHIDFMSFHIEDGRIIKEEE